MCLRIFGIWGMGQLAGIHDRPRRACSTSLLRSGAFEALAVACLQSHAGHLMRDLTRYTTFKNAQSGFITNEATLAAGEMFGASAAAQVRCHHLCNGITKGR